ncbi:588_t:CDS:2 [Funneliformis mosseae]|uniref:588_t:CDS:1 n=1 Tax=Funneliformis mosseae TaxID=27381 RepID=A0A9N8ZR65_FUNMO|nr:588_t:CDS:2 [Funneliformis mosseae]
MAEQSENIFSSHTFVYDYPNSSKIETYYQANRRLFSSFYNIISLETYSTLLKLT